MPKSDVQKTESQDLRELSDESLDRIPTFGLQGCFTATQGSGGPACMSPAD